MYSLSWFVKEHIAIFKAPLIITGILSFLQYWTFAYFLRNSPCCLTFISIIASVFTFCFVHQLWRTKWRVRVCLSTKQVIVISGCDTGLGFTMANYCHRSLCANVIAGVLDENSEGAKILRLEGIKVLPLDITNDDSVEKFTKQIHDIIRIEGGELYALVNNAGILVFGDFECQTANQIRRQIDVNVFGTMRLTKSMMPLLRRDCGRILIVTSHCATGPLPGLSVYGATKAALSAWATALKTEVRKFGIPVVLLTPGGFFTESNITARQNSYFQEMNDEMTIEQSTTYAIHFVNYMNGILPIISKKKPRMLSQQGIYNIVDSALLDKDPDSQYLYESWRYWMYRVLFALSPNGKIQDAHAVNLTYYPDKLSS